MAISTLKGQNKWVELASSSPTSGTSVSFSSLTEYANYKIVYFNVNLNGSDAFIFRINNDSGNNYAYLRNGDGGDISSDGVNDSIALGGGASGVSGVITINDANQVVKEINWSHAVGAPAADSLNGAAIWNSPDVINRFDLSITLGQSFTSGTVKVYGRN